MKASRASRWRLSVLAIALTSVLEVAGCASSAATSKASDPAAAFDAAVSAGDKAWAAGDARRAYENYSSALRVKDAQDTSGTVAAKLDKAKRLVTARYQLSSAGRDFTAVDQLVEVLRSVSADSTEAASARSTIVAIVESSSREMRKDTTSLRKAIKSSRSVSLPSSATYVQEKVPGWRRSLSTLTGPASKRAVAGVDALLAASKQVSKAFGRTYADDALKDLSKVDGLLDTAERNLDAFAVGK